MRRAESHKVISQCGIVRERLISNMAENKAVGAQAVIQSMQTHKIVFAISSHWEDLVDEKVAGWNKLMNSLLK